MLLAYAVFTFVLLVLFFAILAAIDQGPVVTIEEGSALVVDLSLNLVDTPPDADPSAVLRAALGGDDSDALSLRDWVSALHAAKDDPRIGSILITGSFQPRGWGTSFASLREARAALEAFKSSGKPIIAYLDNPTLRDLYVASVADEMVFHPFTSVMIAGLSSESFYLANAFEKYGIGVQMIVCGDYKSAGEMFSRSDMSEFEREARTALINGIWEELVTKLAQESGMEPAALAELATSAPILQATKAVELGIADGTAYFDEIILKMEEIAGKDVDIKSFKQVDLFTFANQVDVEQTTLSPSSSADQKEIAIVYAEGEIVDGEGEFGVIGGDKLSRTLRLLRKDENVAAVVVRVNSPGGSAFASEVILREVRLLSEAKPVVVSMGGMAASGGYWISLGADRIFAEPTTITGSIGVVGLVAHIDEFAADWGVTFDGVKTGPYADLFTVTRPRSAGEMAMLQAEADTIYDEFLARVSAERGLPLEAAESLAGGRVWIGSAAQSLGLVDQLGGLQDALDYAISVSALAEGTYTVIEYPRKKSLTEAFTEALSGGGLGAVWKGTRSRGPLDTAIDHANTTLRQLNALNDPRHLYLRAPFDLRLP